jgi:hypothetical protein
VYDREEDGMCNLKSLSGDKQYPLRFKKETHLHDYEK